MASDNSGILYAYIDEAGDLNFKGNGSTYFIMTCVLSKRPFDACVELMGIRYDLIESGDLAGYFHASEDRQAVRDSVFEVIVGHADEYVAFSVTLDKSKCDRDISPREVYRRLFLDLIKDIVDWDGMRDCQKLIVITDDIPHAAKKDNIQGSLKTALKRCLAHDAEYRLIHQHSEGDFNLQVADYICWALFRKLERDDERSYSLVENVWNKERPSDLSPLPRSDLGVDGEEPPCGSS